MFVVFFSFILNLVILLFFYLQAKEWKDEREELLDRIMSVDYIRFEREKAGKKINDKKPDKQEEKHKEEVDALKLEEEKVGLVI